LRLCTHGRFTTSPRANSSTQLSIELVALVTGYKDWKMLKRYANLQPENLHKFRERKLLEQERLAAANSETAKERAPDLAA
jgi:hypothetical protein